MNKVFDAVDCEKEKIYREVEEHYICEDIARRIYDDLLQEHLPDIDCPEEVPDEIWELIPLSDIYQDWLYSNDANFTWWTNIDNAIESILSEEDKEAIIAEAKKYYNKG